MARVGHWRTDEGRSRFRVFAPGHADVAIVLPADDRRVPLVADEFGHWQAEVPGLADGTRYLIEVDGRRVPDVASRSQPEGVHAASAIATPSAPTDRRWRGVPMADLILYELHLGTYTPEGTLRGATARLGHLSALGINAVELMPIAAFPGQRNWGYDGVYPYALHADYGSYADLRDLIDAAHAHGIAVLLDVVHNHFGPEGNHSAALAPYTKEAPTPWGTAINLDGEYNHGIREFFLENVRYWLEDVGFDGLRMDAVATLSDNMPVHFLREATDLARTIGAAQGRHVLMIAEHLRNDRHVTSATGFHFDAQWNDDLNHAIYAHLTGDRDRHCINFGSFGDVVRALDRGFVLDGTRYDRYRLFTTGTDAATTTGAEHVVHLQNHDQVGNRLHGDRMIATHGRAKALLAMTAVFASPYVPMLFMGEEYGETAPFLFFEDFGDAALIEAVRRGRRRDTGLADGDEPPDPHALSTFEASKLRWERLDTAEGRAVWAYTRRLIELKRAGTLGPRDRSVVRVVGDERTHVIRIEAPGSVTLLNFAGDWRDAAGPTGELLLCSAPLDPAGRLPPHSAAVYAPR